MADRPRSAMAHIDAIDHAHAGLQLQIQAGGHAHLYGEALADLRSLVASLRNVMDDRATGEFPRLRRDREKRDTPADSEDITPANHGGVLERRRRPTDSDKER